MKNLKLLFLFLILNLSTQLFSQVQLLNTDSVKNYLTGTWEWYKSCGGIAGFCYTPASPGYTTAALKFTKIAGVADSLAYTSYQSGTVAATGTTKITFTTSSSGTLWFLDKIQFSAISSIKYTLIIFIAKPDSLWLMENCSDCFLRQYKRNNSLNLGINHNLVNANDVMLFPNPCINQLKIQLPDNLTLKSISIQNQLGMLFPFELSGNQIYDLGAFKPGIYFVNLNTNQGTLTKKLVISP